MNFVFIIVAVDQSCSADLVQRHHVQRFPATYVLIAIVKKELQLEASRYTCLQTLSASVFEKTELLRAWQPDRLPPRPPSSDSQLILFDI